MASSKDALFGACFGGQAREVQSLLSGGADVNGAVQQGRNPLMAASNKCHVEVVDIVLAAEANVNAADDDGQLPD